MRVYAIRHGQTKMNAQNLINSQLDDELTDKGIEQARTAGHVIPTSVARIYSSPLHRTRQTAELINETVKLPLTFHDELKEVDFGVLTGTEYTGEAKVHHIAMDYDWRPSGEDVQDVKTRVQHILGTIHQENGDGEALIVAHGGIIRMLHFLESGEAPEYIENTSIHEFDLEKLLAA
jgi:broad specificity phosphatase PhoE